MCTSTSRTARLLVAWALFVLRSVECNCLHAASGVHLGRAQRLLHRFHICYIITIAQRIVVPNIGIQRISCENSISRLSRAKVVLSFDGSVIKPKEVSQVIYKRLYLNVSLLIEA